MGTNGNGATVELATVGEIIEAAIGMAGKIRSTADFASAAEIRERANVILTALSTLQDRINAERRETAEAEAANNSRCVALQEAVNWANDAISGGNIFDAAYWRTEFAALVTAEPEEVAP